MGVARCGAAAMNLATRAAEQSSAPWRELLPAKNGDELWSWPPLMRDRAEEESASNYCERHASPDPSFVVPMLLSDRWLPC